MASGASASSSSRVSPAGSHESGSTRTTRGSSQRCRSTRVSASCSSGPKPTGRCAIGSEGHAVPRPGPGRGRGSTCPVRPECGPAHQALRRLPALRRPDDQLDVLDRDRRGGGVRGACRVARRDGRRAGVPVRTRAERLRAARRSRSSARGDAPPAAALARRSRTGGLSRRSERPPRHLRWARDGSDRSGRRQAPHRPGAARHASTTCDGSRRPSPSSRSAGSTGSCSRTRTGITSTCRRFARSTDRCR